MKKAKLIILASDIDCQPVQFVCDRVEFYEDCLTYHDDLHGQLGSIPLTDVLNIQAGTL